MSMTPLPHASVLAINLAELRARTLRRLAVILSALGHLWLMAVMWLDFARASSFAWVGATTLAALPFVALAVSKRHLATGSTLLVMACLVAVAAAILSYARWELVCLLVLPVIFASVLLGLRPTLLGVMPLTLLAMFVMARQMPVDLGTLDLALPMGVIMAVALLSVQSLYSHLV